MFFSLQPKRPKIQESVSVRADDGTKLFELKLGEDQRSIEVRAIEGVTINEVYYADLEILPHFDNKITLRLRESKL